MGGAGVLGLVDKNMVDAAVEHAQTLSGVSRGGLKRTRVTSRGAIADAIRAGLDEDLSHFSVQG